MDIDMKIFKTIIIIEIIFIFFSINCQNRSNNSIINNCQSYNSCKLDLLLQDIFRKSFLFPNLKFLEKNDSLNFYFLISENFEIPNKRDYYIFLDSEFKSDILDSTKLIPINKNRASRNLNNIVVSIIERNIDTSKVKISVNFSSKRVSRTEAIFSYEFYNDSCSWLLKDSTFWQY